MGGVVEVIKDAVDDIISFIGRPFGIYTHDETFTDIQVSNLLTPGIADANAKRTAKHNSYGNLETYWKGYRGFQRDYRKKYSYKFLEALGYNPSSTAETRVIVDSMVATYIQNLYGYTTVAIEVAKDGYMTLTEKGKHARYNTSGYNNDTGILTRSGKTYTFVEYYDTGNGDEVGITWIRDPEETVVDNLTTNYSYDDVNGTIVVDGHIYDVVELVANTTSTQYETTYTDPLEVQPDGSVFTNKEYLNEVTTNSVYESEATYIEYRVTSGEVTNIVRYLIAVANTLNIYDTATVNVTAIIPMKENNVMVDLGSRNLERMLRKLNLSVDQLKGSIENPDMDSAYLMTAVDVQQHDSIHDKILFNMFDLMAPGNGNVVIAISELSMRYSFTMTKTNITGSIGAVGTYQRVDNGTNFILRYQGSASEYKELSVTGFEQEYTVSGGVVTTYWNSTGGYTRLVIPLDLLNSLTYTEFVHVYERSLCMLAYATTTVEVKWYETGAFGNLLKIVGFVLIAFGIGSVIFKAAEMTLSAAISYAATELAVGAAISYVAMQIAEAIGGSIGAIIGVLAAYYAAGKLNLIDTASTKELWLKMANDTIGTINQEIQHKMELATGMYEDFMNEIQEKIDDLNDKLKEFDDSQYTIPFNSAYAGTPNPIFIDIDRYCNGIVGENSVESIVDYSSQIAYNIETRNSVRVF